MKRLALTLTLAVWGFTTASAQTLPVIGTVLRGQVKNVISLSGYQNSTQFRISNTGTVPLEFYVAATASAVFSGQGVTIAAGQQRDVSVSDLGGLALGQYVNAANNALSSLLPGTFTFDLKDPGTGGGPGLLNCTTDANPTMIYQKAGTADYFFCDPLATSFHTTRLGIGIAPSHVLHVYGDVHSTNDISTNTDIFASGSMGVGTTNTSGHKLAVNGDIYSSSDISTNTNVFASGSIGIGTTNISGYKLAVNGDIRCKRAKVETGWSDFVFEKDYKLMSLNELETYIVANHHLPEIPAASQVENDGADVGHMLKLQMQKIEELTLYVIKQQKEIDALKQRLDNK